MSRQKGTDYSSYIGQLNSSITSLSSTVASVGGNWAANTKKGKTDWVGFGSDVVVDFTAGAGATAVGSTVGSLFLPPLGTVVGTVVGMGVNWLANDFKYGNPPKSTVDHVKSGVKKFVKDPVGTIGGIAKWAFGG